MTSLRDEVTESIKPGDDFYNYVNQKWRDENPIPSEKSRYAAFTELSETVTSQLHTLLESNEPNKQPNAPLAKQFYLSGMDIELIESKGGQPIQPFINEALAI